MNKPTLLFIDPCCPRPYDPTNVDLPGIGGTEHTVVQLAKGLSTHYQVVVEQHNREEAIGVDEVCYAPLGATVKPAIIIVLRDPAVLPYARERSATAQLFLYSHDVPGRPLAHAFEMGIFENTKSDIVAVSHWHRTQIIETLRPSGFTGQFRVRAIYNPISEDAVYEKVTYDRNTLVWLASPHKGLDRAYEIFERLLTFNKDFKLYVTNPGYLEDRPPASSLLEGGVINVGTLPHRQVLEHLRGSLCLFYPNTVFPETFGKIMAEANAVGTPVIAHPIGATREVLDSHPGQILDCRDTEAVVKRVLKWYNGERPMVRGKPAFKINNVVAEWVRLFSNVR